MAAGLALMTAFAQIACSPGEIPQKIENFFVGSEPVQEPPAQTSQASEPLSRRVYMDEISGQMTGFDSDTLVISNDGAEYELDIAAATIESIQGLVFGDEISVIYEGRLKGTDTSGIKALKVTDALIKSNPQKPALYQGTLISMNSWSMTVVTAEGVTVTIPVIGRPLYFSQGIRKDMPMSFEGTGSCSADTDALGMTQASHMVLSHISDTEPFSPPADLVPSAVTAAPGAPTQASDTFSRLRVTVEAFDTQTLRVRSDQYDTLLTLDISGTEVSFPEGILPGTAADLYYTGTFNGKDLTGIKLSTIRGVPASRLQTADIRSHVTGVMVGFTADTLTLRTADDTLFTCRTSHIESEADQPLLAGAALRIVLDPSLSDGTNIYRILGIHDA